MSVVATKPCRYCASSADRALLWAEGKAYVPLCADPGHEQVARERTRDPRARLVAERATKSVYHLEIKGDDFKVSWEAKALNFNWDEAKVVRDQAGRFAKKPGFGLSSLLDFPADYPYAKAEIPAKALPSPKPYKPVALRKGDVIAGPIPGEHGKAIQKWLDQSGGTLTLTRQPKLLTSGYWSVGVIGAAAPEGGEFKIPGDGQLVTVARTPSTKQTAQAKKDKKTLVAQMGGADAAKKPKILGVAVENVMVGDVLVDADNGDQWKITDTSYSKAENRHYLGGVKVNDPSDEVVDLTLNGIPHGTKVTVIEGIPNPNAATSQTPAKAKPGTYTFQGADMEDDSKPFLVVHEDGTSTYTAAANDDEGDFDYDATQTLNELANGDWTHIGWDVTPIASTAPAPASKYPKLAGIPTIFLNPDGTTPHAGTWQKSDTQGTTVTLVVEPDGSITINGTALSQAQEMYLDHEDGPATYGYTRVDDAAGKVSIDLNSGATIVTLNPDSALMVGPGDKVYQGVGGGIAHVLADGKVNFYDQSGKPGSATLTAVQVDASSSWSLIAAPPKPTGLAITKDNYDEFLDTIVTIKDPLTGHMIGDEPVMVTGFAGDELSVRTTNVPYQFFYVPFADIGPTGKYVVRPADKPTAPSAAPAAPVPVASAAPALTLDPDLGPDMWTYPLGTGQSIVVMAGETVYAHPQGGVIKISTDGVLEAWDKHGKIKSTTATHAKLNAGHGQWKYVGTAGLGAPPSAPTTFPTPAGGWTAPKVKKLLEKHPGATFTLTGQNKTFHDVDIRTEIPMGASANPSGDTITGGVAPNGKLWMKPNASDPANANKGWYLQPVGTIETIGLHDPASDPDGLEAAPAPATASPTAIADPLPYGLIPGNYMFSGGQDIIVVDPFGKHTYSGPSGVPVPYSNTDVLEQLKGQYRDDWEFVDDMGELVQNPNIDPSQGIFYRSSQIIDEVSGVGAWVGKDGSMASNMFNGSPSKLPPGRYVNTETGWMLQVDEDGNGFMRIPVAKKAPFDMTFPELHEELAADYQGTWANDDNGAVLRVKSDGTAVFVEAGGDKEIISHTAIANLVKYLRAGTLWVKKQEPSAAAPDPANGVAVYLATGSAIPGTYSLPSGTTLVVNTDETATITTNGNAMDVDPAQVLSNWAVNTAGTLSNVTYSPAVPLPTAPAGQGSTANWTVIPGIYTTPSGGVMTLIDPTDPMYAASAQEVLKPFSKWKLDGIETFETTGIVPPGHYKRSENLSLSVLADGSGIYTAWGKTSNVDAEAVKATLGAWKASHGDLDNVVYTPPDQVAVLNPGTPGDPDDDDDLIPNPDAVNQPQPVPVKPEPGSYTPGGIAEGPGVEFIQVYQDGSALHYADETMTASAATSIAPEDTAALLVALNFAPEGTASPPLDLSLPGLYALNDDSNVPGAKIVVLPGGSGHYSSDTSPEGWDLSAEDTASVLGIWAGPTGGGVTHYPLGVLPGEPVPDDLDLLLSEEVADPAEVTSVESLPAPQPGIYTAGGVAATAGVEVLRVFKDGSALHYPNGLGTPSSGDPLTPEDLASMLAEMKLVGGSDAPGAAAEPIVSPFPQDQGLTITADNAADFDGQTIVMTSNKGGVSTTAKVVGAGPNHLWINEPGELMDPEGWTSQVPFSSLNGPDALYTVQYAQGDAAPGTLTPEPVVNPPLGGNAAGNLVVMPGMDPDLVKLAQVLDYPADYPWPQVPGAPPAKAVTDTKLKGISLRVGDVIDVNNGTAATISSIKKKGGGWHIQLLMPDGSTDTYGPDLDYYVPVIARTPQGKATGQARKAKKELIAKHYGATPPAAPAPPSKVTPGVYLPAFESLAGTATLTVHEDGTGTVNGTAFQDGDTWNAEKVHAVIVQNEAWVLDAPVGPTPGTYHSTQMGDETIAIDGATLTVHPDGTATFASGGGNVNEWDAEKTAKMFAGKHYWQLGDQGFAPNGAPIGTYWNGKGTGNESLTVNPDGTATVNWVLPSGPKTEQWSSEQVVKILGNPNTGWWAKGATSKPKMQGEEDHGAAGIYTPGGDPLTDPLDAYMQVFADGSALYFPEGITEDTDSILVTDVGAWLDTHTEFWKAPNIGVPKVKVHDVAPGIYTPYGATPGEDGAAWVEIHPDGTGTYHPTSDTGDSPYVWSAEEVGFQIHKGSIWKPATGTTPELAGVYKTKGGGGDSTLTVYPDGTSHVVWDTGDVEDYDADGTTAQLDMTGFWTKVADLPATAPAVEPGVYTLGGADTGEAIVVHPDGTATAMLVAGTSPEQWDKDVTAAFMSSAPAGVWQINPKWTAIQATNPATGGAAVAPSPLQGSYKWEYDEDTLVVHADGSGTMTLSGTVEEKTPSQVEDILDPSMYAGKHWIKQTGPAPAASPHEGFYVEKGGDNGTLTVNADGTGVAKLGTYTQDLSSAEVNAIFADSYTSTVWQKQTAGPVPPQSFAGTKITYVAHDLVAADEGTAWGTGTVGPGQMIPQSIPGKLDVKVVQAPSGPVLTQKQKDKAKQKSLSSSYVTNGGTILLPLGGSMQINSKKWVSSKWLDTDGNEVIGGYWTPQQHKDYGHTLKPGGYLITGIPSADAHPSYLTAGGAEYLHEGWQVTWVPKSVLGKSKGAPNASNIVPGSGAPLPSGPPPAPVPAWVPPGSDLPMSTVGWKQVGKQDGSNPGGLFVNPQGVRYYVKAPKAADRAENEVLAAKLYGAAGIKTPEVVKATIAPGLIPTGGKVGITSKIVDGKKNLEQRHTDPEYRKKVVDGFAVDAWLANWDAGGTGFDNMIEVDGEPLRVDVGGSLMFRAQGEPKGDAFGDTVVETVTMTTHKGGFNTDTATVFGKVTKAELRASFLKHVAPVTPAMIDDLVDETITDEGQRAMLKARLKARRADLAKQVGEVLPEDKPPPTVEVPGATPLPYDKDLSPQSVQVTLAGKDLWWHTTQVPAPDVPVGAAVFLLDKPEAPWIVTKHAPKPDAAAKMGLWGKQMKPDGTFGEEKFMMVEITSTETRQVNVQSLPAPGWAPPPPPPPPKAGVKLAIPAAKWVSSPQANHTTKLQGMLSSLTRQTELGNAYKAATPEMKAVLAAAGFSNQSSFVSEAESLSSDWDGSSNDSNSKMLAFHHAIAIEFGLSDAAPWGKEQKSMKLKSDTKKHFEQYGAAYQIMARLMYENTQRRFAEAGVTSVRVWRGMTLSNPNQSYDVDNPAPPWAWTNGMHSDVNLRPISSFSWSKSKAMNFGTTPLLETVIPVEAIFSMGRTGPGGYGLKGNGGAYYGESEVAVLGIGGMPVQVTGSVSHGTMTPEQYYAKYPEWIPGQLGFKADGTPEVWPYPNDDTEDWIKVANGVWPFVDYDGDDVISVAELLDLYPGTNPRALVGLPVARFMPPMLLAEILSIEDDDDDMGPFAASAPVDVGSPSPEPEVKALLGPNHTSWV